ncbi:hypothetical protein ACJJTC_010805 [Scirpophaga incertulas]
MDGSSRRYCGGGTVLAIGPLLRSIVQHWLREVEGGGVVIPSRLSSSIGGSWRVYICEDVSAFESSGFDGRFLGGILYRHAKSGMRKRYSRSRCPGNRRPLPADTLPNSLRHSRECTHRSQASNVGSKQLSKVLLGRPYRIQLERASQQQSNGRESSSAGNVK